MNKNVISCLILLLLASCSHPTTTPSQEIQSATPDSTPITLAPSLTPYRTATPTPTPTPTPSPIAFPEFPTHLLIESLPTECPAVGKQAYQQPDLELPINVEVTDFSIALSRGKQIVVNTPSDEANGDTSSLEALLENPGDDGISLREALMISNNAPGEYTIQFDPALSGAVIQVGAWDHSQLPPLEGGSVIINGDVDGNRQPDITLENRVAEPTENNAIFGLRVHSSHNTLFGLAFSGFTVGVFFDAPSTHQVYTDNTLGYLVIEGESGIALYSGRGSEDAPIVPTYNRWENTHIIGNTIIAYNGSGISILMHRAAEDSVTHLTIVGNHIRSVNDAGKGGSGIAVSAGFGPGSNRNHAEYVLIAGNIIEGNPHGAAIELSSGFMSAEVNTIRNAFILDNTIRESYAYSEYMHTFGIQISAGFWVNQEGNLISDVVVARNTLEGNPEISVLISSGSVGSGKNLIERVLFHSNRIHVTQPAREDGIPVGAIAITTGDGATDYNDPSVQPVVYPNDNILRDVWVSGNVVEGQGGSGIMLSTGDWGAERNRVERIYILGNEFEQFFPDMGVLVTALSLEHGGRGDNVISEVFIQQNTIRYTNLRESFVGEEFVSGGIVLSAGNGASGNITEDIRIVANDISSPAPGINLVAGWAQPQFPPSVGNTIRDVQVWCNVVAEAPILLEPMFPGIKGINLAGGWGLAENNLVESIDIAMNVVVGEQDQVSIFDNAGEGSQGNTVEFIFSHSALREGWDNPNVSQICILNRTISTIRNRQEIGRGMRLAVD